MASTSRSKKRKFEEKKKIDFRRTCDINLGTGESAGLPSILDVSKKQCEKSIQARCSPTRFVNLCTKLKDEFRMAVSEMGFSSLLEMSSCTIFRPLLGWLVQNFNVEDASLSVHGKSFILTPLSFEMVMGVKDGGEDFEQRGSSDEVRRRQEAVRGKNATISIAQLEKELIEAESVDDMFVIRFVLFTVGTLLMPTTSLCVGTSMVGSINGLESVRKSNWATKSFTYLVDAIRDFKEKKGAFVGGCVLFLQVFYLHHLEGHSQYIDRSILPIAAWTEKKSKDVVAWINEGLGYGSKKIRMRETQNECHKCQPMHCDCKLEIQELKQLVVELQKSNGELQQSNRELQLSNWEVVQEISKMRVDFMKSFKSKRKVVPEESGGDKIVKLSESDQLGVAGENGGDMIVRNDTNVSDKDESENDSQNRGRHSSDSYLDFAFIAMYNDFVRSGGYKIGPFELTQSLFDSDSKKIVMYIFNEGLDKNEVIAQFGLIRLSRFNLQECLQPKENWIFELVIDAYASLLTGVVGMQSEVPENRECWFSPTTLAPEAEELELEGLLDDMDTYNSLTAEWRTYFGNLSKCNKIVIPVSTRILPYCWSTAVVNLKEENVVLWHPVTTSQEVVDVHEEVVRETLRVLDHVLADDIKTVFPNGLSLRSFKVIPKTHGQRIDIWDEGIFSLKQMWAASKGMEMDSIPKFNINEFRLEVAIELVQSQFNEVSASVLEKCRSQYFDLLVRRAGRHG